jgi:hypothetical protein
MGMNEEYSFRFQVQKVDEALDGNESRHVHVLAKVFNQEKELVHEGRYRVKFNDIGVFPFPADIAGQVQRKSLQRLLMVELKRYIKPQRRFLTPGEYKPVW